jgi:hypothetical protein
VLEDRLIAMVLSTAACLGQALITPWVALHIAVLCLGG